MTTLIHLVSEQTMQNVLPILAFRPDRVVQIRSADARFDPVPGYVENAVQTARNNPFASKIQPAFQSVTLADAFPTAASTRDAIADLLRKHPNAILNYTGGTKQMAIGAFLAAAQAGRPTIYCDTDRGEFVSGETGSLPEHTPLTALIPLVDVSLLLAAHGKSKADWRHERFEEKWLDFGRRAFEIRSAEREAFREFSRALHAQTERNGRVPGGVRELSAILQQPLAKTEPEPVRRFLDLALAVGLVVKSNGSYYINCRPNRHDVQAAIRLLDGSWLEWAAAAFASDGHRFRDIHVGVRPAQEEEADFGETDIVCADSRSANLRVFSCKTSPPSLEHLASLVDRSRRLGGRYAGAGLCVLHADDQQKERLKRQCQLLQVRLVLGAEIRNYFCA